MQEGERDTDKESREGEGRRPAATMGKAKVPETQSKARPLQTRPVRKVKAKSDERVMQEQTGTMGMEGW